MHGDSHGERVLESELVGQGPDLLDFDLKGLRWWLRLLPWQAPPQADAYAQEPDDLQDDADEADELLAVSRRLRT